MSLKLFVAVIFYHPLKGGITPAEMGGSAARVATQATFSIKDTPHSSGRFTTQLYMLWISYCLCTQSGSGYFDISSSFLGKLRFIQIIT